MIKKFFTHGHPLAVSATVALLAMLAYQIVPPMIGGNFAGQAGGGQCATFGQFTKFDLPTGISVGSPVSGPGNALWFVGFNEANEKNIQKMTLQGMFTQFAIPAGVDVQKIVSGRDGTLWTYNYVQNAWSTTMYSISPSGVFSPYSVPFPFLQPMIAGIARIWGVTLQGQFFTIHTVDYSGLAANLYNAGRDPNSSWAYNFISDMTPAGDDSAWFTQLDNNGQGNNMTTSTQSLKCINPQGVARSIPLGGMNKITNIVSDLSGNIWGIEEEETSNEILKIVQDGTVTRYSLPSTARFNGIFNKLVLGSDGNMWTVVESGETIIRGISVPTSKIVRVQQDGTMTMFALPNTVLRVENLLLGPDGNLWLTGYGTVVKFDLCSQPLPVVQGGCGIGGPVARSSSSGQGSSTGTTQCNNGAGTCNAILSGGSCTTQQITCPPGTSVAPGAAAMACTNGGCAGACVFCQPSQGNSSSSGTGTNSSGGNNRVIIGPSVCAPQCGDSKVRLNEQCDDGNRANNDGCSSTCTIEKGWECLAPAGQASCRAGAVAGISASPGRPWYARLWSAIVEGGSEHLTAQVWPSMSQNQYLLMCEQGVAKCPAGMAPTYGFTHCPPWQEGWTVENGRSVPKMLIRPLCEPNTHFQLSVSCPIARQSFVVVCLPVAGGAAAGAGTAGAAAGAGTAGGAASVQGGVSTVGNSSSQGTSLPCANCTSSQSSPASSSRGGSSSSVCDMGPSTCSVICGDGIRAGIELCDDGNKTAGDGCSPLCVIEPGARCMAAGSSGAMSSASQPASCTPAECGAQPGGSQSVLCSDGSVGGPVCQRGAGGVCGWVIRSCPSGGSVACSDTDGGFNIWTAGTAGTRADVCESATSLNEARCSASGTTGVLVACPFSCLNGACTGGPSVGNTAPVRTCIDGDAQNTLMSTAVVLFDSQGAVVSQATDSCSGASVVERVCSSDYSSIESVTLPCGLGTSCLNGACR